MNDLNKPKVTITMAALNEEDVIGKTVRECLEVKDYDIEVLVILDGKTTDRTAEVAAKEGAIIVQTGEWKGKGAALRAAMPLVKGDYVLQMDADYQFMPFDIPKMIEPLRTGYDMTVGSRYEFGAFTEYKSVTPVRHFGIWLLSLVTSWAAGQRVSDMPAGYKGFRKPVLKDIGMQVDHYGYEAEVIIRAAQKGYRIKNVPITYRRRPAGRSNLVPIKHGLLILSSIIKTALKK